MHCVSEVRPVADDHFPAEHCPVHFPPSMLPIDVSDGGWNFPAMHPVHFELFVFPVDASD